MIYHTADMQSESDSLVTEHICACVRTDGVANFKLIKNLHFWVMLAMQTEAGGSEVWLLILSTRSLRLFFDHGGISGPLSIGWHDISIKRVCIE
jgi:hypothetical protein